MSGFIPFDFLNWALRLSLAQAVIILFMLLPIVSFSLPHAGDFKPFFLLMAVYYWAVYRPTVMPVAYTFVLALIMDLLADLPMGLNALIMIGLQILIQRSRVFLMGQSYVTVWLGFAIVAVCYAFALWLAASLFSLHFYPPMPLAPSMIAALFSILLFPLASLLLHSIHKVLPVSSDLVRKAR